MRHRFSITAAVCLLASPLPILAQEIEPGVPPQVLRRLAQAIWPRNLFDSAGRPEPPFRHSGLEPDYSDLRVVRSHVQIARLPTVNLYVAAASPRACSHCRTWTAAVAQRDTEFLTLVEPEHLTDLLSWADPPLAYADSLGIRDFITQVVHASCLFGCVGFQQVRSRSDLSPSESQLLRAADNSPREWRFPRTYTHTSPGQMYMEFVLRQPSTGLYRVIVQQQQGGRALTFSIEPAAYFGINP